LDFVIDSKHYKNHTNRDRYEVEKVLRKEDVEWVQQNRALRLSRKKKGMTNRERQHYYRIREKMKLTLEGLVALIEAIPEKQLEQVSESIEEFLKALFSLKPKKDDLKKRLDDPERRRKRVIRLWDVILSNFAMNHNYANELVGKDVMRAFTSRMPPTLEAIYYATMFKAERKP